MPLPAKRCVADNDVVTANSGPEPLGETVPRLAPINTVVVGIDGSGEARRGLLFAADLAETLDADLLVVHAFGLVGSFGDWRDGVHERELQVNTVMVDEWCAPLADRRGLRRLARCGRRRRRLDRGGVARRREQFDAPTRKYEPLHRAEQPPAGDCGPAR
jgi:hypothetical protein